MKHFKKIFLLVVGAVISTAAFANDYFYCNNTYIYPGDTLERTQQVCGKPLTTKTEDVMTEASTKVTRFIYHHNPGILASLQPHRTAPYSLIVDVANEKVVGIKVLGEDVQETDYCRADKLLKVGDSARTFYQICGLADVRQPDVMRKVSQKKVKQTIMTYQNNQYLPPVKLKFYDGKLVSVER